MLCKSVYTTEPALPALMWSCAQAKQSREKRDPLDLRGDRTKDGAFTVHCVPAEILITKGHALFRLTSSDGSGLF